MFELSSQRTVAEIAAESPSMLAVLKSTGLFREDDDTTVTLGHLCWNVGLHPRVILNMLAEARALDVPDTVDVSELDGLSLIEVVDNIAEQHHDYLRRVLPEMTVLMEQVVQQYAERDARLHDVGALFGKIAPELEGHLVHEEESLFTMIRDMAEAGKVRPTRCGQSVGGPILCMENDHNQLRKELDILRRLTDHYAAPAYACDTYRRLLEMLADFDANTVVHMQKEDAVLFPRAQDAQAELSAA